MPTRSTAATLRSLERDRPVPAGSGAALSVTWFGTTCELLSDGATSLLIDPFVSRSASKLALLAGRRVVRPEPAAFDRWLRPHLGDRLAAAFATHSHFDHLLDIGAVADATPAQVVGSASTLAAARSLGVLEDRLRPMAPGEPMRFGDFTVTAWPSKHSGAGKPLGAIGAPFPLPARNADFRQGGTFVLIVEHPLGNLLINNSAGCVPGLLAGQSAGTAFLSVAAVPADLDAYLRETVDAVGAERVFLVHWDDFTRPLDRPLRPFPGLVRLTRTVRRIRELRPGLPLHVLPVGVPQLLG